MRIEVSRDLSKSQKAFLSLVWPQIKDKVGGGEIVPVESVTDKEFADKKLDVLAGIDAWQVMDKEGMRGVASRVQFDDKSWDTFTIRYDRHTGGETEFQKRLRAINSNNGMLYPWVTCHAYCSRDATRLWAVGAVYTEHLIRLVANNDRRGSRFSDVQEGKADWYMKVNKQEGRQVDFAVVPWLALSRREGVKFVSYAPSQVTPIQYDDEWLN